MQSTDLFSQAGEAVHSDLSVLRDETLRQASRISGLRYLPDFISPAEEARLLELVDAMPWSSEYSRRRQHYGQAYYAGQERKIEILPLPGWLGELAEQLKRDDILKAAPAMALINEYLPGQGISPHVDLGQTETVTSLSLGSGCVMEFTRLEGPETISLWLEPRSLAVMQGEARHRWKHGISKRKKDLFAGRTLVRERRVSITFRGW